MAKRQSFEEKGKKQAQVGVTVKVVRSVKSDKGSTKFTENLVRLDEISKVTEIK